LIGTFKNALFDGFAINDVLCRNEFFASTFEGNFSGTDRHKNAQFVHFGFQFIIVPFDIVFGHFGGDVGTRFKQQWDSICKTMDGNAFFAFVTAKGQATLHRKGVALKSPGLRHGGGGHVIAFQPKFFHDAQP
jgi:hypothetical protein